MNTLPDGYDLILKKHLTLCDVSKKYTFEKVKELVPEVHKNIELIQAFFQKDDEPIDIESDDDKTKEFFLPQALSLTRLLQKQEEYDALIDYLSNNLIVSIASSYDIYLSSLLKKLIIDKKMHNIIEKQIPLCDILKYSTKEDLIAVCVEEKISELMRKSHKEQINWVEKSFKIDIINSFSEWKTIFEFFQIRNIVVHNDGIVNQILIDELKKNGISSDKYTLGEKIAFNPDEISKQIRCIIDFSTYIFSLILRTFYSSPTEIEAIDDSLNYIVYNYLRQEKYSQVISIVDNLLKTNQHHNSAHVFLFTINKCIALKCNHNDSYKRVLAKLDWSNCEIQYKMARAVILDEVEEACRIMTSLDKEKMLYTYVEWPLFKNFIKTTAFKNKFKEIYGTNFEDTLSQLSDEQSQYLYESKIIESMVTEEADAESAPAVTCKREQELALV